MMADAKRVCASSTGVFSFEPCVVDGCRGVLGPTDVDCPKCMTPDYVREIIRSARAGKHEFKFPIAQTKSSLEEASALQKPAAATTPAPTKIVLSQAQLIGVDLSGALLAGMVAIRTNLHKARLHQTDLEDADLTDAVLTEADLSEARLSRANLDAAKMSGAHMTDVQGAFAFCVY
jgi:hypothetical protein